MAEDALLRALVEFADTLVEDYEPTEFANRLCGRCVDLFGVDAAGIQLAGADGALGVAGASDGTARGAELLQQTFGEGPCLDAHRTGREQLVEDLGADERWPAFSRVAGRLGVRASFSFPLRVRDAHLGALNLFRREPGPLAPADLAGARTLACLASVGMVNAQVVADQAALTRQLQTALDSRVIIEQAKGVVAAGNSLDMDHAFAVIRRHARDRGARIHAIAQQIVDGALVLPAPDADHLEPTA
jgi:GAF domain-containing protein